jgi:hypothetical protein
MAGLSRITQIIRWCSRADEMAQLDGARPLAGLFGTQFMLPARGMIGEFSDLTLAGADYANNTVLIITFDECDRFFTYRRPK